MANIFEILARFKRAKTPDQIFGDVCKKHEGEFAFIVSKNLRAGKNLKGGWLPKYNQDPYFNRFDDPYEAAKRYMNWKRHISDPSKPADVMDMYITGEWHRNIITEIRGMDLVTSNDSPITESILEKTDRLALGVSREGAALFIEEVIMPEVREKYSQQTGIKKK